LPFQLYPIFRLKEYAIEGESGKEVNRDEIRPKA
jgi:hypothetical protein